MLFQERFIHGTLIVVQNLFDLLSQVADDGSVTRPEFGIQIPHPPSMIPYE